MTGSKAKAASWAGTVRVKAWCRSSMTRRLAVGAISEPVKTQFGYHIIQVEEKDPNRELNAYTLSQKKSEAFQTWLTDVRNAAKIERNWTADKLPPTPGAG
jgi:hypothetical protein